MIGLTERQVVIAAQVAAELPAEKQRTFLDRLDALLRSHARRERPTDYEVQAAAELARAGLMAVKR